MNLSLDFENTLVEDDLEDDLIEYENCLNAEDDFEDDYKDDYEYNWEDYYEYDDEDDYDDDEDDVLEGRIITDRDIDLTVESEDRITYSKNERDSIQSKIAAFEEETSYAKEDKESFLENTGHPDMSFVLLYPPARVHHHQR